MAYADYKEILASARDSFIKGKYTHAEPLLKQLLLLNNQEPEVYQMLATIFYDQGKFNKAIATFKRALEIDPNYTDASIGLSIILNDLGRYEEGKQIFKEAQDLLQKRKSKMDPQVEAKLASKHFELAALYEQYQRYTEALEQYYKAYALSTAKEDLIIKIADCFVKDAKAEKAVKELQKFLQSYPQSIAARMRLGVIFYNANKIIEAIEQWELILARNPRNEEAKNFIRLAQRAGVTDVSEMRT